MNFCWHKWSKWGEPVQTYSTQKQQWAYCEKCNKIKFRTLGWDKQTTLFAVLESLKALKGESK